jgi:hypothetical protein
MQPCARKPLGRFRPSYWSACCALLLAGCSAPDAASTTAPGPGDILPPNLVLDGREQRELLDAMRAPGAGLAVKPLVPAPDGVRWSDVETAVRNVADKQFLGVAAVESTPTEFRAELQTQDGQDAKVVVQLGLDGRITADATIGIFSQLGAERRFEKAFDAELLRLGAIPKPQ